MALQLDENFLKDLGLQNAPSEQKRAFIAETVETLELRVIERLGHELSDEQNEDFERTMSQNNNAPDAAVKWLQANVPTYEKIVNEELEKLKADLKSRLESVMNQV